MLFDGGEKNNREGPTKESWSNGGLKYFMMKVIFIHLLRKNVGSKYPDVVNG